MFPHERDDDWVALATGGLYGFRAWRLRQHLARCPACRSIWEETRQTLTLVQAYREASIPDGLRERIAAGLSVTPTRARLPFPWRPLAALGGLAALLLALALLVPGSPGRPMPAFADVEQAMGRIRTAHWVQVWTPYDQDGHPKHPRRTEFWARTEPPAVVCFALPDATPPGRERRSLTWFISSDPDPREFLQLIILENTLAPDSHKSLFASGIPWESERATVQGRPMEWFHRQTTGQASSGTDRESVWADPVTHRIFRSQHQHVNRYTGRTWSVETLEGFQYDETPPQGVFDWSPPPGAIRVPPGAPLLAKPGIRRQSDR